MLFCVTKNSILYGLYELNTKAFVSVFCENKFRPAMKCNGKCKLAQMAKEQDKKDASEVLANLHHEIFLYHHQSEKIVADVPFTIISSTQDTPCIESLYAFLFLSSSDKPPQFFS